MNIWEESARKMVQKHGYIEAKRLCVQYRDMNSEGTPSFAFHNATLKALNRFATVGKLSDIGE